MKGEFMNIPSEEVINNMSVFLKALSDSTRIKILFILVDSEYCVGDIASKVGMSDSAVSHQLQLLRQVNLVKNRREGKSIYYFLSDNHVKSVLMQTLEHVLE
jgi:hypothetical protein